MNVFEWAYQQVTNAGEDNIVDEDMTEYRNGNITGEELRDRVRAKVEESTISAKEHLINKVNERTLTHIERAELHD